MTTARPLLAPTILGPYRPRRLRDAYEETLHRAAEAEAAMAATAYEFLGAIARELSPEAACLEIDCSLPEPALVAVWADPQPVPANRPLQLWRRDRRDRHDPTEHLWLRDLESLLPATLLGEKLRAARMPGRAGHGLLLHLPAPDVAAALASHIRRAHPHAAALLLSVDSAPHETDFQLAHVLDHSGHPLFSIHDTNAPGEAWWAGNKRSVIPAVRHLWLHPEHRPRYFQPQGHESQMWNHGLQALVLPAIPALTGPSAT
ncbi:hypothetical protein [Kitasatospora griseola]